LLRSGAPGVDPDESVLVAGNSLELVGLHVLVALHETEWSLVTSKTAKSGDQTVGTVPLSFVVFRPAMEAGLLLTRQARPSSLSGATGVKTLAD
jgi:hypothetical protein